MTTVDSGDRPILDLLHRQQAMTVRELCVELDVTATAVRQRLSRLHSSELIEKDLVRSGRGRPTHSWRLTDAGRRELGENYGELALTLWHSMLQDVDETLRQQILQRLQSTLVERYGADVTSDDLTSRFTELSSSLARHGFSVEVDDRGGLPVLRETHCPYHDLAAKDTTICELEQVVFSEILGTELELGSCCREGDSCCEFQPTS